LLLERQRYFLQEAGEPMKLSFEQHQYGPYSDGLRHALERMEGHFIRGLGDGVVEAEIEPDPDALSEATEFAHAQGNMDLDARVKRVAELIDGFQSPYGMELLATVHWVARRGADSLQGVVAGVQAWNDRKRQLMSPDHIEPAWSRLRTQSWLAS
jgi:hypothetical protein